MTLTVEQARELRALTDQAFEVRRQASAYLPDAVDAIVEWFDRRALRELERDQERQAHLIRVLRETRLMPREGQLSFIDRAAA